MSTIVARRLIPAGRRGTPSRHGPVAPPTPQVRVATAHRAWRSGRTRALRRGRCQAARAAPRARARPNPPTKDGSSPAPAIRCSVTSPAPSPAADKLAGAAQQEPVKTGRPADRRLLPRSHLMRRSGQRSVPDEAFVDARQRLLESVLQIAGQSAEE